MPPDTIYLPGTGNPPPPEPILKSGNDTLQKREWQESMNRHFDSLEFSVRQQQEAEKPHYPLPQGLMFLIVLAVLGFSAYLYIIRPSRKEWLKKQPPRLDEAEKQVRDLHYDQWLSQYNPYYRSLNPEQKQRFLYRVKHFIWSKEFRFHSMVEEEYIKVLISGAAIQLSFGLRNYLMDYFDVIHIMRREYVLNIDKETYYGHVSKNGIYISWNKFLEGYDNYNDSINVGLHEMAHAIQYDAYLGFEDRHDRSFKDRLDEYSAEGRPVFRAMREGMSHLLDDYAMTNFDEFWAVSVETFFENPVKFREKLPSLYKELSELLNQNPEQPGTILDPELA